MSALPPKADMCSAKTGVALQRDLHKQKDRREAVSPNVFALVASGSIGAPFHEVDYYLV